MGIYVQNKKNTNAMREKSIYVYGYLCQCDVLGVDVFLEEDGGVFAELLA